LHESEVSIGKMKIAFLHYHLKTGGVTTCLKQQVAALKNDCEMFVITGEKPEEAFPVDTFHIPELAYSTLYRKPINPQDIADIVFKAIQTRFNGPADILHVHNPLLAKNKNFLKILKALQKKGLTLFLQVHDFAEDGRPPSYFAEEYPVDCHFSVVNSRDYHILLKAGLKKEGLHQLFNSVNLPGSQPASSDGGPYVVYPIRGIRRKNIGEAILLSLFFENDETLVITLPPNSPADMQSYKDWKAFSGDHHLRVEFDAGLNRPFDAIVRSARYLLTTSITEGFGFSFLEPWLFEKWVWGRKLADICSDFEANGVRLDHMYTGLNVPMNWIGSQDFFDLWKRTIENTCKLFDIQIDKDRIQGAYNFITADGKIDFGLLNEDYQRQVILKLLSDQVHLQDLLKLNPFLLKIGKIRNEKDIVKINRRAVIRNYNMSSYRQKLLTAYEAVNTHCVRQRIDKKILLAEFLDLTKFSLLKWGDYGIR
jgi:glycosyltransferase involved in cell wall biosynthesis